MRLAFAFVLFAGTACADDTDMAQSCLDSGSSCFGKIAEICIAEAGDPAVIPAECWSREQAAWQVVLDRTYSKVLLETFTAPKPVTQTIRAEKDAWSNLRDLRCRVETMSNPRTYNVTEAGCLASMTFERAKDIAQRIGADWTEY